MNFALEIRAACKTYTNKSEKNGKILSDLNLTAKQGSIFCLIGPSGVGKTTLFKCILGITSLDSGEISIFGHDIQKSLALTKNPKVFGYMPQDASLVEELTVKENLIFFSNLYELKEKYFKKRFELLKKSLELPEDNLRVENCSGGEKRRISLAIAILCEPPLLLLDEPTVGVDPILREKIWEFLQSAAKSTNMTIILTTHYVNEAEKSDRIGMLRNGRLLIEDSPKNILEKFDTQRIDQVFATLSRNENIIDSSFVSANFENPTLKYDKKKNIISQQRLKGLVTKNLLVLKRQPRLIAVIVTLPIITLFIIGQIFGYPTEMRIGIVNHEVNCSLVNQSILNECIFENLSCRREKEIKKIGNFKVNYYQKIGDALREGKTGNLYGIIQFRKNFTENVLARTGKAKNTDRHADIYMVNFYPDNTNLHMSYFVKQEIMKSIETFIYEFQEHCNQNATKKYAESFLTEMQGTHLNPIYGSKDLNFLQEVFSAYFLGHTFMLSFTFCCLSVIHDIKNGSWNREILSGVSLVEVILGHFLIEIIVMVFELFGFYLIIKLTMTFDNIGNMFLESFLVVFVYISGIVFGMFFSCLVESYFLAVFTSIGLSIAQFLLSGSAWPFEGMHWTIRPFAWILPSVLLGKALKNMIIKDYRNHSTIYVGFLVPFLWILICVIGYQKLSLKIKEFSNLNSKTLSKDLSTHFTQQIFLIFSVYHKSKIEPGLKKSF